MSMKRWKKYTAVLIALAVTLSLTACQSKKEEKSLKKDSQTEAPKGRYVENEVSLPEGWVYEMAALSDKTLRCVTENGIFDSSDRGETWTQWDKQPNQMAEELLQIYPLDTKESTSTTSQYDRIGDILIQGDGSIFYSIRNKEIGYQYRFVDKEGNIKEINPDFSSVQEEAGDLHFIEFTKEGDILAVDEARNVCRMDISTGSITHKLPSGLSETEIAIGWTVIGEQLLLIKDDIEFDDNANETQSTFGVKAFSLSSNEQQEENRVLSDFMSGGAGSDMPDDYPMFLTDQEQDALYIVNKSGIYRYISGGSVVEKIFDGAMGRMSAGVGRSGTVLNEDTLFLIYETETGSSLMKYSYNPDVVAVPDKQLSIYSLYESNAIRQAVVQFQKNYPDVYVKVETGLTGQDAVTISDALKTLNADIMAGEGPDILALEGMPVDSYMEKGLLADISDVVESIADTEGIFENIAKTYEKDGKIYAIPSRFAVPVLMGSKEQMANITDLKSFADTIEMQRKEKPDADFVIGNIHPYILMKTLLPAVSPSIITDEGTLDENVLKGFFSDVKRICTANGGDLWDEEFKLDEGMDFELVQFMTTAEDYLNQMGYSNGETGIFNLKTNHDFFALCSRLKSMEGVDYVPAPSQAGGVFIPLNSVGISAKSEEIELAKSFVTQFVTIGQSPQSIADWPVDKKAFHTCTQKPNNINEGEIAPINDIDGSTYKETRVWPQKEEFLQLEKWMEGLDTPAVMDEMVNKTILQAGTKFLKGDLSLEEGVQSVVDKLGLYLSE